MYPENLKSPSGVLKISTAILSLVVLVLGLFSYFKSAWVMVEISVPKIGYIKPYQLCHTPRVPNCPDISMERYFVSMTVVCFIFSICSLAATVSLDIGSLRSKFVDLSFHVVAAALLMSASILYIMSANQIDDIVALNSHKESLNFRKSEKLAAASLGIIQALLYSATALFIAKVHKLRGV